jgi:hypothetical protein
MPRAASSRTSTLRRHKFADRILAEGFFAMRPCASCVSSGTLCVLSARDERCEQCYRFNRSCELASPWVEDDRLKRKEEQLREERLRAEQEAVRLRKQERLVQKKRRLLWEREKQNISELEGDEAVAGMASRVESPSRGPTSPTGLSQVSFGSFGRTTPVPTGS